MFIILYLWKIILFKANIHNTIMAIALIELTTFSVIILGLISSKPTSVIFLILFFSKNSCSVFCKLSTLYNIGVFYMAAIGLNDKAFKKSA